MARVMYFESIRSSDEGMLAVGTVVMNRVESSKYPNSVCAVIGQPNQFAPGALSKPMPAGKSRDRAYHIADQVLSGKRHRGVGKAMFFHTAGRTYSYSNMHYVTVAGGNAFYERTPTPGRAYIPRSVIAQAGPLDSVSAPRWFLGSGYRVTQEPAPQPPAPAYVAAAAPQPPTQDYVVAAVPQPNPTYIGRAAAAASADEHRGAYCRQQWKLASTTDPDGRVSDGRGETCGELQKVDLAADLITEERHLARDPVYRDYQAYIREHGIFARLRRLLSPACRTLRRMPASPRERGGAAQ